MSDYGNADVVLSVSRADGHLGNIMRDCIEARGNASCRIISAYSQTKFLLEASYVSTSRSGISKDEFLAKVKEGMAPLEEEVYSNFMAINDIGLNVSTTGTARVRCTYEGKVPGVSAKDSLQYDDGKERVPVHYTV